MSFARACARFPSLRKRRDRVSPSSSFAFGSSRSASRRRARRARRRAIAARSRVAPSRRVARVVAHLERRRMARRVATRAMGAARGVEIIGRFATGIRDSTRVTTRRSRDSSTRARRNHRAFRDRYTRLDGGHDSSIEGLFDARATRARDGATAAHRGGHARGRGADARGAIRDAPRAEARRARDGTTVARARAIPSSAIARAIDATRIRDAAARAGADRARKRGDGDGDHRRRAATRGRGRDGGVDRARGRRRRRRRRRRRGGAGERGVLERGANRPGRAIARHPKRGDDGVGSDRAAGGDARRGESCEI